MHSPQSSIDQLLRDRFRGRYLAATHRRAVEGLLAGRSTLLVTPDEPARELIWQLAAGLGGGPTLVITRSSQGLAGRAEEIANRVGLITCRIDAEIAGNGLTVLRDQLAAGKWDAALVSARQLGDPRVMEAAQALRPRLVVVEEAHCISRHGHPFDPCFTRSIDLAANADCVLALSEVADLATRNDIADAFDLRDDPVVELDLPSLRLEVRNTPSQRQRDAHLLSLLSGDPARAIVLVGSQVEAGRMAPVIVHQTGLPTLDLTTGGDGEFAEVLRRFREGSVRVMVATGALTPDEEWPDVPLVVIHSMPENVEMLYRQARLATGAGARAVFLCDRSEREALERKHLRCAPEVGHLLAIQAVLCETGRASYAEMSAVTGLAPEETHLGVEMLLQAGALQVRARGDDWLEAETPVSFEAESLIRYARDANMLRRTRLQKAKRLEAFAHSRGCRRAALGRAFDCLVASGDCRCDRCKPLAGGIQPDEE